MPKAFACTKFDGTEVDLWIFSMNLYFAVLDVPEHQRAMSAALNMSEEAAVWLRS